MRIRPAVVVSIALLVGPFAAGYYVGTHGKSSEIAAIREQADQDSARFAEIRAVLEDSVTFWSDSAARAEAQIVTVEVQRREASREVYRTGADLEEHLEIRSDTAGLRLLAEHERADAHLAELWAEERSVWQAQLEARMRVETNLRHIIASQDTEMVALRANLAAMQAEAERWYRKANPPLAMKLLKGGGYLLAAAGGYLLAGG